MQPCAARYERMRIFHIHFGSHTAKDLNIDYTFVKKKNILENKDAVFFSFEKDLKK